MLSKLFNYLSEKKLKMDLATEDYVIKRTFISNYYLSEKILEIYTPEAEIYANIEKLSNILCDYIAGDFKSESDIDFLIRKLDEIVSKDISVSIHLDDDKGKTILSLIRIHIEF